jgi:hypothetical protein
MERKHQYSITWTQPYNYKIRLVVDPVKNTLFDLDRLEERIEQTGMIDAKRELDRIMKL